MWQQIHYPASCNNPDDLQLSKTCCEIFKSQNMVVYLVTTLNPLRQYKRNETNHSSVCRAFLVQMTVARLNEMTTYL